MDVVALDWKWLFIYPDQGVAAVNQLVIPAGTPVEFRLTSATVMNSFFVPQLGSQIYTMGGMTTHLSLLADKPGEYPGFSANFSGDGFSEMRFVVKSVPAGDFNAWLEQARGSGSGLDDAGYAELAKPSKAVPPTTYRSVEPKLFERILDQTVAGPGKAESAGPGVRHCVRREVDMLGRLSWAAIPFNEPLPLISGAVVGIVILAVLVTVTVKGWWPYLWREWLTSVDHKRIGIMYVAARPGHAAARLFRCDHDAHAAGDRGRQCAGISASRALRPDLLGARHDHDLFRGDAARHRADELCRAVAARRARRRFSRCSIRSASG